jgi:hypothetical protein
MVVLTGCTGFSRELIAARKSQFAWNAWQAADAHVAPVAGDAARAKRRRGGVEGVADAAAAAAKDMAGVALHRPGKIGAVEGGPPRPPDSTPAVLGRPLLRKVCAA